MRRIIGLTALCFALYSVPPADAGWGAGGCPPTASPATVVAPAVIQAGPVGEWQTRQNEPDCFYLYKNGQVVAGFDLVRKVCYIFDGKWSDVIPLPPGFSVNRESPQKVYTGVVNEKVKADAEARSPYRVNGKPATQQECMELLGKPELPEDGRRPFLVAVGSKEFQKQVTDDFVKAPGMAAKVRFNTYGPDSFQAKKLELQNSSGFRDSGKYVCLLAPDGEALAGSFSYEPGDIQKFDPDKVGKPGGSDPLVIIKPYIDQALLFAKKEPLTICLLFGVGYLVFSKKKGT